MDQLANHSPAQSAPEAAALAGLSEEVVPDSSRGPVVPASAQPGRATPSHENDRYQEPPRGMSQPQPAATPRPSNGRPSRGLAPSECTSCQQGGGLVFALGELGYDFGSQARMDAIDAEMDDGRFASNPRDLLEFLTVEGGGNLHFASAILWTLNHDVAPFLVLRPEGPFAREVYTRLLEFFADQLNGRAERVSVPGVLDGTVTLLAGQRVPVAVPDLRALCNWKTSDLVANVVGSMPEDGSERMQFELKQEGIRGFLERIYFEVRNTGQTPQERALNFAATNAFNLGRVFESAAKRQLQLDEIAVEPSPICRPDSECWDVRLIFFDPSDAFGPARTAYRFTVDVSDVVPVLVGPVRSWAVR